MSSLRNPTAPPSSGSEPFSAERYYSTQSAPASLEDTLEGVRKFVEATKLKGRRLVLVTSGGTTVPLELNVVRFLDNFSAGTRGATSAEYFLSHDYAVIFMHRQFSQQPFLRHYSHSTNPFLDLLDIEEAGIGFSTTSGSQNLGADPTILVNVSPEALPLLVRVLRENKRVKQLGTLHTVTFVTVDDYLFLLRGIAGVLGGVDGLGKMVMYYLAAAVSDFFLPRRKMAEHKIQSGKGSLQIEMDQVPKILKPLVNEWTPEGYIVSFKLVHNPFRAVTPRLSSPNMFLTLLLKLETDPQLLIPKSRAALERYGHQVVVGNELHTRKYKVVFVEKDVGNGNSKKSREAPAAVETGVGYREEWITIEEEDGTEIEKIIVEKLIDRHSSWIKDGQSRAGRGM